MEGSKREKEGIKDIAPCDFCRFGDLKMKLKGEVFDTLDDLQGKVEEREDIQKVLPTTHNSTSGDFIPILHRSSERAHM
jgi:hypothetical protein